MFFDLCLHISTKLANAWNDYYEGSPVIITSNFQNGFQNDTKYYSKCNQYMNLSDISIQIKYPFHVNITLLIEECSFTNIKTKYFPKGRDYACGAVYLRAENSNITLAKNSALLCYNLDHSSYYYYSGANFLSVLGGILVNFIDSSIGQSSDQGCGSNSFKFQWLPSNTKRINISRCSNYNTPFFMVMPNDRGDTCVNCYFAENNATKNDDNYGAAVC